MNPKVSFQFEDAIWNVLKLQSSLVTATKIIESSLANSPVQHLSTKYAGNALYFFVNRGSAPSINYGLVKNITTDM